MSIKTSSIYTSGNNVYFYSDRVKVFPCAYRNNKYDATARLNTEYNFTHLPHMVDKASYIIEFTEEKLICVIQGYYFEIELGTNDSGISDYSILYNTNKYLNICVASPSITSTPGTNFIESPHLCSWDKLSSIEGTLDIEQIGGTFFAGLKIGDGVLSNGAGYQCYALKLDDSAKLPIMANKIENIIKNNEGVENGTGKPINQEFTTEILSATTSISTPELRVASDKLIANSDNIIAKVPVIINSALDVKTGDASVLTAGSTEVTINKPTTINGGITVTGTGSFGGKLTVSKDGADITGDTQIKKSSSKATDGNLTVAGTGKFGGKLTVTTGGADITGATILKGTVDITGKTTIGSGDTKTEIENDAIKTSKITIEKASNTGSLVIDKTEENNHIIEIKDKSNTTIFSVNTESGETFAKKINATVEGTSANAINAKNVTDTIKGTNITDIFGSTSNKIDRLKLRRIEPDTDATWVPGADQSVKIILKKDTDPVKTKAVSFFLAKGDTATVVEADEFIGVAETAQAFNFPATIQLSGDVAGKAESKYGWTIKTTINDSAVTNDKLAGDISNDKLVNDSITIGGSSVSLGGSIGTSDNPFTDSLYFGKSGDTAKDCKLIITGQYTKSWMEFPLEIEDYHGRSLIQFTNNYGAWGTTSVPKQIIYAATPDSNLKGKTELFGDKICIYAQGHDYTSGTIEAGTVDLSKGSDNIGLKIKELRQIKVHGAGLKSSTALQIVKSNNYDYVKISNGSSTINSLLVNGLSEFTSKATFGAGISVTGTAEATTFNASSDKRLKENIIDYKPEKSILDLPIKKFDFIDGPKNQIGCIAQDLKEICPEIVNENEKGYLSIQESKLVYLLLDEVKKLKNEVEKLKRK